MHLLMLLTAARLNAAAVVSDDPEGTALVQAAQRIVSAYHAEQPRNNAMLRVVYFHPSDRDPLPNYAERLDRVLTDISEFYRDGMRRFGIESNGLPLERKDGRLVLHLVRGQHPASHYRHESGDETEAEARAALKGVIDFDREHVLILHALCRREPDGRYVFDAPYYGKGGSSQQAGLCHAADCELIDTRLLTETTKKIVYREHYYERMVHTLARFNSWYIGGIAHEAGHGFGLDHDAGGKAEARFGTSLMGGGNHTYRQEVWGGGKPTFLSRVSALQLLSHPLFTGSNRGRWDDVGFGLGELMFSAERRALRIRGELSGTIPAYAVVAYVWPSESDEHGRWTYPVGLPDRTFTLSIGDLAPGRYRLQLSTLHVNGGTTSHDFEISVDRSERPDVAALNETWLVTRASAAVAARSPEARRFVSDEAVARAPSPEAGRKLAVLRSVIDPGKPIDLPAVTASRVFLSDVTWIEAKTGWGRPVRNYFWCEYDTPEHMFLMLSGQFFDKGLYAHSSSRYAFALDEKWKTFTATVGIRDGAQTQGSAIFTVRGDGRELYRSPMLRVGARRDVKVDVTGVKQLELLAEGGEGHPHNSWAIWAEPLLTR